MQFLRLYPSGFHRNFRRARLDWSKIDFFYLKYDATGKWAARGQRDSARGSYGRREEKMALFGRQIHETTSIHGTDVPDPFVTAKRPSSVTPDTK